MGHNDAQRLPDPALPAIELRDVSKSYGVVRALRGVSLELRDGEILGLVGENGAGKSTLIGVLSGTVSPDRGELYVRGRQVAPGDARRLSALGVSVVVQEQALVDVMPVYENLFLGREARFRRGVLLQRGAMRRRAASLLDELQIPGIPVDAPVASLSFAQRQLVEIAKAFIQSMLVDARPVVLLDEPTSALSEAETEILFRRMDEWRDRAAFIFVSHLLDDVLRVCSRLVVLKDGVVVDTMPTAGVGESDLHELMVGRQRSHDYYREGSQRTDVDGPAVLTLRSASVRGFFADVDLALKPGEVVGVAGVVGSGKSQVAAAAAGALRLDAGELVIDGRAMGGGSVRRALDAGVAYVPPERRADAVLPYSSVQDNLVIGSLRDLRVTGTPVLDPFAARRRAQELVARLDIRPRNTATPCAELSGGNQQKVVFGRWLRESTKVLVLDEPTRGIDVGTKEQLYDLIRQLTSRGVAVLLTSENLEEVIGMSNRILVMRDGRVTHEIPAPAEAKPAETDVIKHMV
jgi:ABC-type sugar transport system ATPase subunit